MQTGKEMWTICNSLKQCEEQMQKLQKWSHLNI